MYICIYIVISFKELNTYLLVAPSGTEKLTSVWLHIKHKKVSKFHFGKNVLPLIRNVSFY